MIWFALYLYICGALIIAGTIADGIKSGAIKNPRSPYLAIAFWFVVPALIAAKLIWDGFKPRTTK